jgi:hypothetical protein
MTLPSLRPVADLAGYPLSDPDLEQVASILDGILEDIRVLRGLDVPDDIEPIITFRVEPWTR